MSLSSLNLYRGVLVRFGSEFGMDFAKQLLLSPRLEDTLHKAGPAVLFIGAQGDINDYYSRYRPFSRPLKLGISGADSRVSQEPLIF